MKMSPQAEAKASRLSLPDTSVWAGLDSSAYPGNTFMSDLWSNTNMFFTGFYLGETSTLVGPCCHPSSSWMPESSPGSVRSFLEGVGFGFLPIYVGQQDNDPICSTCNVLTHDQGVDDANHASNLMNAAGFADGTVCWLDIETGGTLSSEFMAYITAWVSQLNSNTPNSQVRVRHLPDKFHFSGRDK
jgi:hypothetical protein